MNFPAIRLRTIVPLLALQTLACVNGSMERDAEFLQVEPLYDENGEPLIGRAAPDHELLPDGSVAISDRPLTLLIVFDTSSSMVAQWDVRSRWQAAYDSVVSAVTAFQDTLTVGAVVFPTNGGCGVEPIESGLQFDFQTGPSFLTEWQRRVKGPAGSTPLGLGLQQADAAIARATELGLLENRFRVMVFTDGEPTCEDDRAAMERYPARWLEHGIHTYVLALPGSSGAASLLDAIAIAGGTGAEAGGGPAVLIDPKAQEIYDEGVEEEGASRVVVDEEDELESVAHAGAR